MKEGELASERGAEVFWRNPYHASHWADPWSIIFFCFFNSDFVPKRQMPSAKIAGGALGNRPPVMQPPRDDIAWQSVQRGGLTLSRG